MSDATQASDRTSVISAERDSLNVGTFARTRLSMSKPSHTFVAWTSAASSSHSSETSRLVFPSHKSTP